MLQGGIGFRIASIVASGLAPLALYFVLSSRGMGDTEALAVAWFVPVLWTLGSSIWRRKIDLLGMVGIATYGIAVAAAVFLGAGSLPLKLHRALITGVVGVVCLISFAIRRPIIPVLARRLAASRGFDGAIDPDIIRRLDIVTLIVGVFCMADAAVHTALAILLPTGTFLLASAGIHVVLVVGIVGGAYLVFRSRLRALRGSPPAAMKG